jgi:hypothetical protein
MIWSHAALLAEESVSGLMVGSGSADFEGRVIALVFVGVCTLIALCQLIPALRRLFTVSVDSAGIKKETKKASGN